MCNAQHKLVLFVGGGKGEDDLAFQFLKEVHYLEKVQNAPVRDAGIDVIYGWKWLCADLPDKSQNHQAIQEQMLRPATQRCRNFLAPGRQLWKRKKDGGAEQVASSMIEKIRISSPCRNSSCRENAGPAQLQWVSVNRHSLHC